MELLSPEYAEKEVSMGASPEGVGVWAPCTLRQLMNEAGMILMGKWEGVLEFISLPMIG